MAYVISNRIRVVLGQAWVVVEGGPQPVPAGDVLPYSPRRETVQEDVRTLLAPEDVRAYASDPVTVLQAQAEKPS